MLVCCNVCCRLQHHTALPGNPAPAISAKIKTNTSRVRLRPRMSLLRLGPPDGASAAPAWGSALCPNLLYSRRLACAVSHVRRSSHVLLCALLGWVGQHERHRLRTSLDQGVHYVGNINVTLHTYAPWSDIQDLKELEALLP
jgi:hypothetical protein